MWWWVYVAVVTVHGGNGHLYVAVVVYTVIVYVHGGYGLMQLELAIGKGAGYQNAEQQ